MGVVSCACAQKQYKLVTKILFLDVGMEKEQKKELGRRVSVFLQSTTVSHYVLHVHSVQWSAGMGNTDTLHPNSCFCSFSILHLE